MQRSKFAKVYGKIWTYNLMINEVLMIFIILNFGKGLITCAELLFTLFP